MIKILVIDEKEYENFLFSKSYFDADIVLTKENNVFKIARNRYQSFGMLMKEEVGQFITNCLSTTEESIDDKITRIVYEAVNKAIKEYTKH